MKSKFLQLKKADFWKGLILSVLTAIINSLYQIFSEATTFDTINWEFVCISSATAFIGYLIKNFVTNSDDKFMKGEQS